MQITAFSATNPSDPAMSAPNSALGQQEFLQLLVTQLQNQDPTNPMDDRSFIAQMAQLSTLSATNGLASQVQQLVTAEQQVQALQMVQHVIEYTGPDGQTTQGKVTGVNLGSSPPGLLIDSHEVPLSQVQKVL